MWYQLEFSFSTVAIVLLLTGVVVSGSWWYWTTIQPDFETYSLYVDILRVFFVAIAAFLVFMGAADLWSNNRAIVKNTLQQD